MEVSRGNGNSGFCGAFDCSWSGRLPWDRQLTSDGADSYLVWFGAWHLWLAGHQPQGGAAQAVHAHQRDHWAPGLSGCSDRSSPWLYDCHVGRRAARQDSAGFEARDGRSVTDLRNSLRALVYRRAPIGEGVALGNYAWRNGYEHARRALAAWTRSAFRPGGFAQEETQSEKGVAAGSRTDCAAHGSVVGRNGPDGCQPRGWLGATVHVQAAAGQGSFYAAPTPRAAAAHYRAGLFRNGGSGHHFVLAHTIAIKGRPAADCGDEIGR